MAKVIEFVLPRIQLTEEEVQRCLPWMERIVAADITSLPREHKEKFGPNKELVALLETLLKQAQEGKLQAAAVALVYADDLSAAGWCGTGWSIAPATYFGLSHAIGLLRHRWDVYCESNTI